jgi:fructokinase
MIPVTAIGEILVDFTPIVEQGRTVGFRMHLGGSPCNVAVALARLGVPVEFVGKVSTDFFGRFLVDVLTREGVGTRFLTRTDAPTTLAFVAVEDGEPSFLFYGTGTADTLLAPDDLPPQLDAPILHFGSISLVRGTTAATVAGLVTRMQRRCLLSCDPNIRPALVADPPAFRRTLRGLLAASDVVKMSLADASWIFPGRALSDVADEVLGLGAAVVVITRGAAGAYARTAAAAAVVDAARVSVVDTVGAGDAFTAGLLFALQELGAASRPALEGLTAKTLRHALRVASAAAALTCTRAGADPPYRRDLEAFLASP